MGIISGRREEKWGSFRGWYHFGVGIISGSIWGSFQGWGSFRGRDHFGGCTDLLLLVIWSRKFGHAPFWPSVTWNFRKARCWNKSILAFDHCCLHSITFGYYWYIYVVVNFLSQVIFIFPFVSTSLAYINIPKNKRNQKLPKIKN